MNYIVFDLEWNQSSTGLEEETARLPFEIIEIGAVKLDSRGEQSGEFSELVRPVIYREMNRATGNLLHLQIEELENGSSFVAAARRFLEWCGEEEYRFCTWGSADLTELQRNMKFYDMKPLAKGPIAYLDVQKLFSIAFEDGKSRRALEHAVDFLELKKEIPFHRAFGDAYYTAKVLARVLAQKPYALKNLSYDVFHPPADKASEIKVRFEGYEKFISREYPGRAEAFEDKEVVSSKCYLCHRNLRKKIRWFTPNGRNYYCLAHCEVHGYLKGKIRVRKSANDKTYIVKTTKLISPEEAGKLKERCEHVKKQQYQHRLHGK